VSYPKVTVVGAGNVGATAAHLMLVRDVADVTLIDIAKGLPQGKALDLMHSRSVDGFGPVVWGTNDYADTAGSQVVVITAGLPRKPGMTRDDLLRANEKIVRSVVPAVLEHSPDAMLLCVTNPLDIMTYLAWKISGLPASRVLGMGGVLDSARFTYFIADATGAAVDEIDAVVMGAHGDKMVPMPRLSTVKGWSLVDILEEEAVEALVERTVFGGAEVVSLLKTGSAFYAPGASVAAMVTAILSDSCETMPSCVRLSGQYGLDDLYMSVPAVLGSAGVLETPELELDPQETVLLQESALSIVSGLEALGLRELA